MCERGTPAPFSSLGSHERAHDLGHSPSVAATGAMGRRNSRRPDGQRPPDAEYGLPDALLVLHQRKSHVRVAQLADADTRRDGDGTLPQQDFATSSDPIVAKGSGIGARTNMIAFGFSTGQHPSVSPSQSTSRRLRRHVVALVEHPDGGDSHGRNVRGSGSSTRAATGP